MRILVVEDEVQLAEAVARGLRREGMAVDIATDGDDGYRKAVLTRYDVVVLDRDLPGMSGDEICRRLSDEGVLTRVLMLTASGTVEDKVAGLALGADDYLAKPFAFAERSEEYTSELQSHVNLVCRLLLEKKNKQNTVRTK